MKQLKLFPKIFFYTLGIMLFIIVMTHGLILSACPTDAAFYEYPD